MNKELISITKQAIEYLKELDINKPHFIKHAESVIKDAEKITDCLTVNDEVDWRGGWGKEPIKRAKVTGIEICEEGSKHGEPVNSVEWDKVREGRNVVVNLDNGSWAYGEQLFKIS